MIRLSVMGHHGRVSGAKYYLVRALLVLSEQASYECERLPILQDEDCGPAIAEFAGKWQQHARSLGLRLELDQLMQELFGPVVRELLEPDLVKQEQPGWWLVHVYFRDEDGVRGHLGTVKRFGTQRDAERLAFDDYWDERLDSAGCSPDLESKLCDPPEDESYHIG